MATLELPHDTTLLIPTSRVKGGRERHTETIRDDRQGQREEVESKVVVVTEDVDERRRAEGLVQEASYAVRSQATHTPIGYLSPRGRVQGIQDKLAETQAKAEAFNAVAMTCQVNIGMVALDISPVLGPEAVQAITKDVREKLESLRNALRAGDKAMVQNYLAQYARLPEMATGPQREAIAFAIDEAKSAKATLGDALKRGEAPESAGRSLDLAMLESAVGMFC